MNEMLHVTSAEYLDGYRVRVEFNSGDFGIADFCNSLNGPIFRPLREPTYFRTFRVEGHTLAWENGADFAPEYIQGLLRLSNSADQCDPSKPTSMVT